MKRLYVLSFFVIVALSVVSAQENIEVALDKIKPDCTLIKSIQYNPQKDERKGVIESVIYVLENNPEQIGYVLQSFDKDISKATMSFLKLSKEDDLISKTLVFQSGDERVTYVIEMMGESDAEITFARSRTEIPGHREEPSKANVNQSAKNKYLIPKGGHVFVNGQKMTAAEARLHGLDIEEVER